MTWMLVFAIATAALVVRGVGPALRQGQDFAPVYCASRLWMSGLNPYDDEMLKAEGVRSEITTPIGRPNFQAVYPPIALMGIAPLALLPFPAARATLLVLNLLALVASWRLIVLRMRWATTEARSLALAAISASLAAVHTCLKDGQFDLVVLLGILLGLGAGSGTLRAGLGWTIALVKYTVSAPYLALAAIRCRRRGVAALLIGVSLFLSAAVVVGAPLGLVQVVRDYVGSVQALFDAGAWNDPARIGAGTASMLWLKPLLYRALSFAPESVPFVNALVIFLMSSMIVLLAIRSPDEGRVLLATAAFTLLTGYHRVYDAVLLLPGIAWIIDRAVRGLDREGTILAVLLVPFLLPGPAFLQAVLSDPLKGYWLVYAFAIPHQTWCLLGIFILVSGRAVMGTLAPTSRRARAPVPLV